MLTKQFGALHMLILAAILSATILVGLGVIYFLDRATISRTLSKKDLQRSNPTEPAPNRFAVDESQSSPTLGAAKTAAEKKGAAKSTTDTRNNQTLPNEGTAETTRDSNTTDSNEEVRAAVQRALEKIQENAETKLNSGNTTPAQ